MFLKNKAKLNFGIISFVVFATLVFGFTNTHAQVFIRAKSFDVLLTGAFIPLDEKGNSKTYELSNQEDKWLFNVTEARVMSGASVGGWRVLSEVKPRRMSLWAGERIIAPLKQPEIVGKTFKLRGRLDTNARRFHLNFVDEIIAEGQ